MGMKRLVPRTLFLGLPRPGWIGALGLVLLACSTAEAQSPRRVPYSQRRGTISPYTMLLGGGNRGLSNYFFFVRPQLQFQRFVDQQMLLNNQFDQALYGGPGFPMRTSVIGAQTEAMPGAIQQRPASVTQNQPRPAATFYNLEHFYPPRMGGTTTPRMMQPLSR